METVMAMQTGGGVKRGNDVVGNNAKGIQKGGHNKDMANLPPSTPRGKRRADKKNKK
jgi:hypothetical protein